MNQYDFVIIGSGIAGLSLALNVAQYGSVALVTKRTLGESNTAWGRRRNQCGRFLRSAC
jgi:L-aspartate oxidase